ncbi:imidazoleglycerol-phosphate dehydratase [Candidatus Methanoperedens nitroreducens]|uniref:Imidazoleglycerol-phosphate dehydratase n=1 Tax=Candidatus Methanoperedens nitratireducens TaxID=1392998 RepID=A0A062V7W7_9EURY|nr:imidazoleglycerol-phosphate dehydratase HisB [Candidatus Methanoperedens nitroreducens]KCZ71440.1 imidazoleglycerol-phosphate dehydratase [Candidatus Methanoperedens nitroreducens]MDJ1421065.1 imidazoleglycerol-phosphate dehydratase HisB [Candidatus Methanoperedens sp.]
MRESKATRKTNETDIEVKISLDGSGNTDINTGIAFFDHMLNSFSKHGSFDLVVKARGDLGVDDHHTIEDVGITLGDAIRKALGDKKGIERFGEARIPMDESLASAVIDISGRSFLVFNGVFNNQKIGNFNPQNTRHFFESLTSNAGINAHLNVEGDNDHHKTEALFKAFGIALKRAVRLGGLGVPSTKGVL